MVAPQSLSRGCRLAAPHHAAGPVPIEPRARAEVGAPPPRTHVRYTRFSAPAPERSRVAIALAAGAAPAPVARVSLAVARSDVVVSTSRGVMRSDFPVQGRERVMPATPVRSRAAPGGSQGVAIPREAWGARRATLRR